MDNKQKLSDLTVSEFVKILESVFTVDNAEYVQKQLRARANPLLGQSVKVIGNARLTNALNNAGVKTIGDLIEVDRRDIWALRNIGKKSLEAIDEYFEKNGLAFLNKPTRSLLRY